MARSPDDPLMGACVAFLQPHAALVPRGNARPRPPPEDDQRALDLHTSLDSKIGLYSHAPNTVGRRLTEYLLPSVAAATSGNQDIHQVPGRKD